MSNSITQCQSLMRVTGCILPHLYVLSGSQVNRLPANRLTGTLTSSPIFSFNKIFKTYKKLKDECKTHLFTHHPDIGGMCIFFFTELFESKLHALGLIHLTPEYFSLQLQLICTFSCITSIISPKKITVIP